MGRGVCPLPCSSAIRTECTMKSKFDWEVTPIKILAFDQSTKKTGWAVFRDKKLTKCELIDCDDKNLSPAERFEKMCRAVQDVIDRVKPDLIVLEDVAMQTNAYSLITLSRLQGVIISACFQNHIEFYICPPSSWRKDLGFKQGKGHPRKDLKKQAIAYCKDHHGVDLDEDRADAVCIGDAFTKTYLKEAN